MIEKLKAEDKYNAFIDFVEFKRIFIDCNINVPEDDFNFIVYKMKQKAIDKKASILDLDTEYLRSLGEIKVVSQEEIFGY
ncbi:MAG: hypothetical protein MJY42_00205 [Bacteroidales bacterium]|nr:hypothetical protein [Bacteroidales bacterium]